MKERWKKVAALFVLGTTLGLFAFAGRAKADTLKECYAEILGEYRLAFQDREHALNYPSPLYYLNPQYVMSALTMTDAVPVYRLMDLNGDGRDELMVGLYQKSEKKVMIFDAFTYRGGDAKRLKKDIGYRSGTFGLRKGKVIESRWSGGAPDNGVTYYQMDKDTKKLKTLAKLRTTLAEDGTRTFYKGSKVITEKQYNGYIAKYGKVTKYVFRELTNEAERAAKNGKFSYSGQKKWKVATE